MKSRFTTIDIRATIAQMRQRLLGMRVANVYDIDNRTYLIKVAKPDMKAIILMESGNRIHETEFDWPKNMSPSGFSMKMRKHLRTRRLESIEQLGIDRIIDMQFGSGEAAYHIILELYDRGNIVLTDFEYTILNILRPRTDECQDVRFAVREKYPVETARQPEGIIAEAKLMSILLAAKEGDNLKKILNPQLVYGPALIEHSLFYAGIPENARMGKEFKITEDMPKLKLALEEAEMRLHSTLDGNCKGYIIQKREKKATVVEGEPSELLTYNEFHPFIFKHHQLQPYLEFENFNKAVDEFFSKIESQKLDMKTLQQEKQVLKKLDNVKKDHEKRLVQLQKDQDKDKMKAQLIEINLPLVDKAILVIKSALANQIDWTEINGIVKEAQAQKDMVAGSIKKLKLESNHITMLLGDPYADSEEEEEGEEGEAIKPMFVDIDLALSAYANARKFYDMKRHAATKEQKTVDASSKAMKSAEKKTKQTLKEVQTTAAINKTRKTYWFEKFLWFVSSENYLVIGGRDQQQNELIVKRYFRPGDIYVHADLHGASSVVIKNDKSLEPIPPKTLNEAGTMAICNSAAWDAKVVTSAWWVNHQQVSKTAPTGEYLTTGSFMIRGKKNYLPPSYLVYGFGFLLKVDEESIFRHQGERRVKTLEEDVQSVADSDYSVVSEDPAWLDDSDNSGSDSEEDTGSQLQQIKEDPKKEGDCENIDDDNIDATLESSQIARKDLDKSENASEEGETLFPDTNIQLQHVKGEKFTLQRTRTTSQVSSTSQGSAEPDDENTVYLGDDQPIILGVTNTRTAQSTVKLSAKKRRELKKKAKTSTVDELGTEGSLGDVIQQSDIPDPKQENPSETSQEPQVRPKSSNKAPPDQSVGQPQQLKRGQKAKMKKIKEKYADQDDEERQLRMEILASAGAKKEEKKKKGKKGKLQEKEQRRLQRLEQEAQKQSATKCQGPQKGRRGPATLEDIKVVTEAIDEGAEPVAVKDEVEEAGSDDEKQAILDEENVQLTQDAGILDALTGQPVPEDTLLNCIPVCAPYSALINYKYKVKLLPGSTKRGKAAKIALNMFMHDKGCTPREKDLFRSVKDADLSRSIPGKVKVSAPNLHKNKHK